MLIRKNRLCCPVEREKKISLDSSRSVLYLSNAATSKNEPELLNQNKIHFTFLVAGTPCLHKRNSTACVQKGLQFKNIRATWSICLIGSMRIWRSKGTELSVKERGLLQQGACVFHSGWLSIPWPRIEEMDTKETVDWWTSHSRSLLAALASLAKCNFSLKVC